jgi:hypothetical protein
VKIKMDIKESPSLIMGLVVMGIVGAVGLAVLASLSTSFTGAAAAAIANITQAIGDFFSLTPVLGIVFISVIILAAVGYMAYMWSNK